MFTNREQLYLVNTRPFFLEEELTIARGTRSHCSTLEREVEEGLEEIVQPAAGGGLLGVHRPNLGNAGRQTGLE
jgi:hypothetical protein